MKKSSPAEESKPEKTAKNMEKSGLKCSITEKF